MIRVAFGLQTADGSDIDFFSRVIEMPAVPRKGDDLFFPADCDEPSGVVSEVFWTPLHDDHDVIVTIEPEASES